MVDSSPSGLIYYVITDGYALLIPPPKEGYRVGGGSGMMRDGKDIPILSFLAHRLLKIMKLLQYY